MDNNFYKKHDIKKGWNHPLASKVRDLGLDNVTTEILQAVCMWKQVYLYKGSHKGLPESLKPQLGRVPTREEVIECLVTLEKLKYITRLGIESEGRRRIIKYDVNKHVIDNALQPPMDNLLSLF